jgi:hypothetical protein
MFLRHIDGILAGLPPVGDLDELVVPIPHDVSLSSKLLHQERYVVLADHLVDGLNTKRIYQNNSISEQFTKNNLSEQFNFRTIHKKNSQKTIVQKRLYLVVFLKHPLLVLRLGRRGTEDLPELVLKGVQGVWHRLHGRDTHTVSLFDGADLPGLVLSILVDVANLPLTPALYTMNKNVNKSRFTSRNEKLIIS